MKLIDPSICGRAFYEWGVCGGGSMEIIINDFAAMGYPFSQVCGFDSWEGLPAQTLDEFNKAEWCKGAFNISKTLRCSPDEAYAIVKEKINKIHKNPIMIKGFYNEVLKDEIIKQYGLQEACVIDIDTDLYESAFCAMDFMFRNNLVGHSCIVNFDDWAITPGDPMEYKFGESRAWREICERYHVEYEMLIQRGTTPHVFTMVRVNNYTRNYIH
jgi:hypothetical protein